MQLSVAGLRFGRFELQPHERRLLVDGTAAPLGARALDVLIALAERAGSLVSKHELMDLVWPDVIVEENNLQAQVSALRKVLGVELIATIPGRGYRFTARVERVEGCAAAAPGLPALASTREAAPPPARSAPETSLAASGLLGRDSDLHALDRAFGAHRLVTLVGPGGVGKTVLAQAYLAGVADRHEHGGYLVRLASLSDGASS
jgi:DNA-binding winged helix-turn-helix (wHTH) protein